MSSVPLKSSAVLANHQPVCVDLITENKSTMRFSSGPLDKTRTRVTSPQGQKKTTKNDVKNLMLATLARTSPVPSFYPCRMRYTTTLAPTPAGGAISNYVFTGNGLYDPDISGTGHQPMGYDQLSALYARVQCFRSAIKLQISDTGSNVTSTSMNVGLVPAIDYSAWSAEVPQQMGEAQFGKYVLSNTHLGGRLVRLGSSASTEEVSGSSTASTRGSYGWQTTVGSNPAYPWYWVCAFQAADGITNIASVHVFVEIIYDVHFFQRTVLDSS